MKCRALTVAASTDDGAVTVMTSAATAVTNETVVSDVRNRTSLSTANHVHSVISPSLLQSLKSPFQDWVLLALRGFTLHLYMLLQLCTLRSTVAYCFTVDYVQYCFVYLSLSPA